MDNVWDKVMDGWSFYKKIKIKDYRISELMGRQKEGRYNKVQYNGSFSKYTQFNISTFYYLHYAIFRTGERNY